MKLRKTTNRIPSLILGFLIIAGNLNAQQRQRSEQQHPPMLPDSSRIVQMVDEMATSLALTQEQKTKVSELHMVHFAEAKKMMEKAKSAHEQHRKKMDAFRGEFEKEVKALLNEEQKAEFEKFVKNRGPRPGQPRRKEK